MDKQPTQVEKAELPAYERPEIQVMTEEEVLRSFQVTHAGMTWWVMLGD